jgi:hypothetical protein
LQILVLDRQPFADLPNDESEVPDSRAAKSQGLQIESGTGIAGLLVALHSDYDSLEVGG